MPHARALKKVVDSFRQRTSTQVNTPANVLAESEADYLERLETLAGLRQMARFIDEAVDGALEEAIFNLRVQHRTQWQEIGDKLGVTKSAVHQKFTPLIAQRLRELLEANKENRPPQGMGDTEPDGQEQSPRETKNPGVRSTARRHSGVHARTIHRGQR